MNFVACNGSWVATQDGLLMCQGDLQSVTGDDMAAAAGGLTWADVHDLSGQVITLFAVAFAAMVLRKLL